MYNHYPFPLLPLPYAYNALSPHLNTTTLHFHHDKHLKTYVDNLNAAIAPYPAFHSWPLEFLLTHVNELPEELQTPVWNNGGGVYNHQLYFDSMTNQKTNIQQPLWNAITQTFGDLDTWKKQMKSAALSQFGSGWAWMAIDSNGQLLILKTQNQDTILPYRPLLLVDVWEHAYYLQYQNRRGDYVDNWFLLIDWDKVSCRYADAFTYHGLNR